MFKKSKKILVSLISLAFGSSCFVSAKMSDPPGTVEQQNEMVKYFKSKIDNYVDNFVDSDLIDKCNSVVDNFDKNNGFISKNTIKFSNFLKLYKDYKLEDKLWNCRVGSSVLFDYLERNKIRCAYVHMNDYLTPGGGIGGKSNHDVVVYSIVVDGKEKWFVADAMNEVFVSASRRRIKTATNKVQNKTGQSPTFNFNDKDINDTLVKLYNLLKVSEGKPDVRKKFFDMGARHVQSKSMNVVIPINGQCLALDFFDYFSNRSQIGNVIVYSDEKDKVVYPSGNSNTAPLLGYWCEQFQLNLPSKMLDFNKKSAEFKFRPFDFEGRFNKEDFDPEHFELINVPNRDGFLEKYYVPDFGEGYIWRDKDLD